MSLDGWQGTVVGILGGLGPAATVTFLDELVRLTDAHRDQDHVDAVVLQHGSVPDRTEAIIGTGPSPGPVLARDAQRLAAFGVDLIALPCNSAHAFIDEIEADLEVDVLSIVDITAERAARAPARTVAVFATEGTVAAGTYARALEARGVTPWLPPSPMQAQITAIIYDQVKAGEPADVALLTSLVDEALDAGADVVLFGCTELSVVYAAEPVLQARPEIVDSLRTLAVATIERSG
ncbi:MAG: amino acid racemase, partial [Actinomycetia bacterium]|nr:amino acid racemase [Actinomycetes bacterium]